MELTLTSTDWRNTSYQSDCAGESATQLSVTIRDGVGEVPPADPGFAPSEFWVESSAVGDLTGDDRPEAAVVLACHPSNSNFAVWEILVFAEGPTRLAQIVVEPLPDALYPGVDFASDELAIKDGGLTVGVMYYGPEDCHSCGPSIHRELSWRWNGQQFVQY
ncbi:hypothetical protein [Actinoplanes regularis]|uniref:hypothetical protein n=1 Tax=Actinoplanes regularis TaxID=52697 RepID=UPI001178AA13|nr:hypothetical protein [Actinoplanes regularis]GIE91642.1 hypothetical protein Are01nite_81220 [Actinoplanes regularis]